MMIIIIKDWTEAEKNLWIQPNTAGTKTNKNSTQFRNSGCVTRLMYVTSADQPANHASTLAIKQTQLQLWLLVLDRYWSYFNFFYQHFCIFFKRAWYEKLQTTFSKIYKFKNLDLVNKIVFVNHQLTLALIGCCVTFIVHLKWDYSLI